MILTWRQGSSLFKEYLNQSSPGWRVVSNSFKLNHMMSVKLIFSLRNGANKRLYSKCWTVLGIRNDQSSPLAEVKRMTFEYNVDDIESHLDTFFFGNSLNNTEVRLVTRKEGMTNSGKPNINSPKMWKGESGSEISAASPTTMIRFLFWPAQLSAQVMRAPQLMTSFRPVLPCLFE